MKETKQDCSISILSDKNKLWLEMALKICKNIEYAKDLVQDMYVRIALAKPRPNKLTDGYIFATLKNLHRDEVKKHTTFIRKNLKHKVYFIDINDDKFNYDISTDNKLIINSKSNER
tara:strand:+ start:264 stop:614 length:351 start_codon:yes stop_codon:yes gene_type:complete